jgi:hypothetical protein
VEETLSSDDDTLLSFPSLQEVIININSKQISRINVLFIIYTSWYDYITKYTFVNRFFYACVNKQTKLYLCPHYLWTTCCLRVI